ncbi:hypothetical protein PA25_16570 [Pseudoalteromonas sp. A25]|uniref:LruC domain-containing protein n=1 Tax=Pseudoalteromonas sp. A25 TaxID=116092 RepID=UPI0012A1F8A7|nr:LruC domain-containing protein [Pseudoalteromonas sp. A25]BBN81672.1 hypothetical protein PA25_16570 [Pseudoalteromonas sp. A25]
MKWLIFILVVVISMNTQAFESVKLKDTIRQGYGDIDLFVAHIADKNPTAEALEWFRQDNSGSLVFAIDVNEAASGSEKAQSQGVTIKYAYLTIRTPNGTNVYSTFSTPTSTVVAPKSDTQRAQYYTVIGDSGSSRITGSKDSDIYGSSFDGTLSIVVPDSLSDAVSAILTVEFLQTNIELGDPEAFYDYGAGYEDVALLSSQDKEYLEQLAAGLDEAPLVIANNSEVTSPDSWVYYPSNSSYFVVSYEDSYPNKGDYDFNDLIVGYQVGFGMLNNEVVSINATGYMIARGASYTHDWYLHIPFASSVSGSATISMFKPGSQTPIFGYPQSKTFSDSVDLLIFEDSKSLMSVPGYEFVNTLPDVPIIKGNKFSVVVNLDSPVPANEMPSAPYDPYLYTEVTGHEVHLPGNVARLAFSANSGSIDTQFKDTQGYPYALVFPDDWLPPIEYVDLGQAYSKFLSYSRGDGTSDASWYLSPNTESTKDIGKSIWMW